MAVTPKSPGVYIDEISVLPPSVAPVATGIPAFFGYTEKGPKNTPTRITSMLEFEETFGGPNKETFAFTVTDVLDVANNVLSRTYAASLAAATSFKMYYAMQMYFANGGGACYIVSVNPTTGYGSIAAADFAAGLEAIERVDEPTLLVFPDMQADNTDYNTIYDAALQLCDKLKDRFVIMDMLQTGDAIDDSDDFRSNITINNLDYGAVYYPNLKTVLSYGFDDTVTVTHTQIGGTAPTPVFNVALNTIKTSNPSVYNALVAEAKKERVIVTPSGAMAGIYASVDRDRGVWKAPANVSISLVIAPTVTLSEAENGYMNIDPTAGKSINAIRAFAGKGTLVWGARTLAGNDNEWRYVNVRRLFNFMEESIKKATESVVFEPNDANTWLRVKGTITNFLTNLWRDGALVGAKPEQAFFVKVGLNETMTAQDILEGKLIIQIGAAASRPAEFIVLQFMHKLQES
jgi:phage tail sheath protein FI